MNDKADEFNIFYSKEDNSLNALVDFIAAYKDKQINIRFQGIFIHMLRMDISRPGMPSGPPRWQPDPWHRR